MKHRTIQFRLTAWYFIIVAVVLTLFSASSWFAMRTYTYRAFDRDLRYDMARVIPFIQSHSLQSRADFDKILTNATDFSSTIGAFVQIADDRQNILYETDVLQTHRVPLLTPSGLDGSVVITTVGHPRWPMRVASSHIVVAGTGLNVHVVQPLREALSALNAYVISLVVLIPIALFLTTSAGYWMSRRALKPVEQIRKDADAIDPANLTARLPIPSSEDELTRLARTLNEMLARIETGFQAVQQFTADASHELRGPLSLITTAAEVSLRRERTREELTEALGKILREARHMASVVENLLTLARGDGRAGAFLEMVDLVTILNELCGEFRQLTDAKGISLRQVIPDHGVLVRGNAIELRRLFLILLDNAVKYTESGSIALSLVCIDQVVEIEVQDTGIGIEPSGLPYVFNRFWRADQVRSRSEGGTGLGLSLAQQIVQHHRGSISVASEFGTGSRFTVQLKLHLDEATIGLEQPDNTSTRK